MPLRSSKFILAAPPNGRDMRALLASRHHADRVDISILDCISGILVLGVQYDVSFGSWCMGKDKPGELQWSYKWPCAITVMHHFMGDGMDR